jgi:hypothetical protein
LQGKIYISGMKFIEMKRELITESMGNPRASAMRTIIATRLISYLYFTAHKVTAKYYFQIAIR